MLTEKDNLEPCEYFCEGMIVYILCRLQKYDLQPMWIPAKVELAAGHSARVANPHYDIEKWIDLRYCEVMKRKANKECPNGN